MKRLACLLPLLAACPTPTTSSPDLGAPADLAQGPLAIACGDTTTSVYQLPANLPAYDASHRGDVIRCAADRVLSAAQINTTVTSLGYAGAALPSGAQVYRIAYRTDRVAGSDGKVPGGVSSALVFLPEKPVAGLVVIGHGTVGLAARCAPSLNDLTATGSTTDDARVLYLALAGFGWTVIAPDYAGFGYGSVSGWSLSEDEAHSLLDATRAMKKLLPPASLPGKVVLVGHSQGGHAVLSAHALAKSYGLEGTLSGVAAFAPLWLPGATWGAAMSPVAQLNTTDHGGIIAFDMMYFYGHGELQDGVGGGVAMFKTAQQAPVKDLLTGACLGEVASKLKTLGATPADLFDDAFVTSMANCAIIAQDCDKAPASKWQPRWRADRPTLDLVGPPIVIWQGKVDGTITPDRAMCGFDRINADLAKATNPTLKVTYCIDDTADHGGVVRKDIAWVNQWIAARVLGESEPLTCPGAATLGNVTCAEPPPNVD